MIVLNRFLAGERWCGRYGRCKSTGGFFECSCIRARTMSCSLRLLLLSAPPPPPVSVFLANNLGLEPLNSTKSDGNWQKRTLQSFWGDWTPKDWWIQPHLSWLHRSCSREVSFPAKTTRKWPTRSKIWLSSTSARPLRNPTVWVGSRSSHMSLLVPIFRLSFQPRQESLGDLAEPRSSGFWVLQEFPRRSIFRVSQRVWSRSGLILSWNTSTMGHDLWWQIRDLL